MLQLPSPPPEWLKSNSRTLISLPNEDGASMSSARMKQASGVASLKAHAWMLLFHENCTKLHSKVNCLQASSVTSPKSCKDLHTTVTFQCGWASQLLRLRSAEFCENHNQTAKFQLGPVFGVRG